MIENNPEIEVTCDLAAQVARLVSREGSVLAECVNGCQFAKVGGLPTLNEKGQIVACTNGRQTRVEILAVEKAIK